MRSALSIWRWKVLAAVRAHASLLFLLLSLLTERPLSAFAERGRGIYPYLLFIILFLYCLAVSVVREAVKGVRVVKANFRTAEESELKIVVGRFFLRFGFRWRLPTRHFIEIITVSLALDQIPLLNHQIDVCVEGCSADARAFLCVLLGQVEVITISIGGKIEI